LHGSQHNVSILGQKSRHRSAAPTWQDASTLAGLAGLFERSAGILQWDVTIKIAPTGVMSRFPGGDRVVVA
jgi:hypothetical protein